MADEPQQGSPEKSGGAPAETPVLTPEQVSEIVTQAFDARMPGFMSSVDKRMNKLQEEVRTATMTEAELEDERQQAQDQEVERLRRENAILSAGADYPEASKAFKQMQDMADGKEQLEFLQSLIDSAAKGQAPASGDEANEEEEEETPRVDPNRSRSTPTGAAQAEADAALLGAFDVWPGEDFWQR